MYDFKRFKQAKSHSIISVIILLQVGRDVLFTFDWLTPVHSQIVSNKATLHAVQDADSELRIVLQYMAGMIQVEILHTRHFSLQLN